MRQNGVFGALPVSPRLANRPSLPDGAVWGTGAVTSVLGFTGVSRDNRLFFAGALLTFSPFVSLSLSLSELESELELESESESDDDEELLLSESEVELELELESESESESELELELELESESELELELELESELESEDRGLLPLPCEVVDSRKACTVAFVLLICGASSKSAAAVFSNPHSANSAWTLARSSTLLAVIAMSMSQVSAE